MSLREKLKAALEQTSYPSSQFNGTRGFREHHIEAILDAIMPVIRSETLGDEVQRAINEQIVALLPVYAETVLAEGAD